MAMSESTTSESNTPAQDTTDPNEVLRRAATEFQADVVVTLEAPGDTPRVSVIAGFDPSAMSVLRSAGHDVSRTIAAATAPYDLRRFLYLCHSATNKTKTRG